MAHMASAKLAPAQNANIDNKINTQSYAQIYAPRETIVLIIGTRDSLIFSLCWLKD